MTNSVLSALLRLAEEMQECSPDEREARYPGSRISLRSCGLRAAERMHLRNQLMHGPSKHLMQPYRVRVNGCSYARSRLLLLILRERRDSGHGGITLRAKTGR
jgi:hypothetical protein